MANCKLKELEKLMLKSEDSLDTAIRAIHKGGKRIALVVDENGKLLGTITDGDIRRALIRHATMNESVKYIMNKEPFVSLDSKSRPEILSLMKKKDLLQVPLLNKQGVLIGLETLHHLIEDRKYNNAVFLMAGGYGTRLRPLTNEIPKPLLTVGGIPILETIINRFIDTGFHNFFISTHYKAEMLRDYFGNGSDLGVSIKYVHEEMPLGTAGSLGLLPDDMSELPVLLMNGDLLTKVNFEQLINFHQENHCLATMAVREYDYQVPYGVVEIEQQHATKILEKPVQKFFVNAGIYVLEPKLIKQLDGLTYIDMPHLLENQINKGERINTFPIHERWIDIGQMEEYEYAHEIYEKEFVK